MLTYFEVKLWVTLSHYLNNSIHVYDTHASNSLGDMSKSLDHEK